MKTENPRERSRRLSVLRWGALAVWVFSLVCAGYASGLELRRYRPLIGDSDSLLVRDDTGKTILSIQADAPRIPASTLKILTALMAIHYLGLDYRFPTEAWVNDQQDLVVRGYGDPLLTSEVLSDLAGQIHRRWQFFQHLILDTSFFDPDIVIPGLEENNQPYNAGIGALCANFNTVAFRTDPGGRLVSDEPQTPLVPLAIQTIRKTGMKSGRISVSRDCRTNARYAGELLSRFLEQQGAVVSGRVLLRAENKPSGDRIIQFESPYRLSDILSRMLEFSSNFLANQLFLACGAQNGGYPATREKAVQAARRFIAEYHLSSGIQVVEGSGISRENRVSASDMDGLLVLLDPYRHLMKHQDGEWFKTGTLDGVRTRAGFLEGRDGRGYRFVVMLNTPGKTVETIVKQLREDLR